MCGSGEFQQRACAARGGLIRRGSRFRRNPTPGHVIFLDCLRRKSADSGHTWLVSVGNPNCFRSGNLARPFREFLPASAPAQIHAEGLKHPLMAETKCVGNDVSLGPDCRLMVVGGSNMSGKSTYLRTIGVNLALALAGAPVRARKFRLTHVRIGASIRTVDSIHEGTSRFYAEITRLGQIMKLAGQGTPLVFLLDEILGGTNSHDRLIG